MGGRLPNGTAHDSYRKTTINIGRKKEDNQDEETLKRDGRLRAGRTMTATSTDNGKTEGPIVVRNRRP